MSKKIKIAIVGVGNCASALVQGLSYYREINENSQNTHGLMHVSIGGYLVRDIEIVAAFDVNANKIGKDLSEAIWVSPNNAKEFAYVSGTGVLVSPGYLGDGIAPHMLQDFPLAEDPRSVKEVLKKSGAEILVSYLPVGSKDATRFYAQMCIDTRVAFINAIPEFIASDPVWAKKFADAGIPCGGDDVMSQVGATILNRILLNLIENRGHIITSSMQINDGGNMDFKNMTDRQRVESKKISKTEALKFETRSCNVMAAPAYYHPEMKDQKMARIQIEMLQFGGVSSSIDLKLEVEDSPNSAGVIVDAIRLMKLSLDRGLTGYQDWSAYYFKHPLEILDLREAHERVEKFIALSKVPGGHDDS